MHATHNKIAIHAYFRVPPRQRVASSQLFTLMDFITLEYYHYYFVSVVLYSTLQLQKGLL